MKIQKKTSIDKKSNLVHVYKSQKELAECGFSSKELAYVKEELNNDKELVHVNQYDRSIYVVKGKKQAESHLQDENFRILGDKIGKSLNGIKAKQVTVLGSNPEEVYLVVEGMALGNYVFDKYFKEKKQGSLNSIQVVSELKKGQLGDLENLVEAVFHTRDLVNEPLSFLTAPQLAKEIKKLGKKAGYKATVFNKKKIEELKMGGLLAVNRGSIDPPTFSILEWKPKNAKNKKPVVLVGKGVVYDTGGLSLKPTANSMDLMKCDMAGSAMMIGTLYAVAKNKLPIHVIALIPATDNRPGLNAYAPGDVVKMHSGHTVEVLNTDAEGRMLLADALSYAKKYKPELVLDSATLTGAAVRAFGPYAACVMGTAEEKEFEALENSANRVFERVIKQPFWKEYGDVLKSDVADFKNLGGPFGGHISAGKFLERFTDYPWMHLDIAGPAFLNSADSYRPKWASGYGVRLMYDFLKNRVGA